MDMFLHLSSLFSHLSVVWHLLVSSLRNVWSQSLSCIPALCELPAPTIPFPSPLSTPWNPAQEERTLPWTPESSSSAKLSSVSGDMCSHLPGSLHSTFLFQHTAPPRSKNATTPTWRAQGLPTGVLELSGASCHAFHLFWEVAPWWGQAFILTYLK